MNLKYYNGDQFFLSRYQLSLTLTCKITLPYKMVVYLLYVDFFFDHVPQVKSEQTKTTILKSA